MKFCKDCKHYSYRGWGLRHSEYRFLGKRKEVVVQCGPYHLCNAPALNPVTGEDSNSGGRFGAIERRGYREDCGPDGKLWEAK